MYRIMFFSPQRQKGTKFSMNPRGEAAIKKCNTETTEYITERIVLFLNLRAFSVDSVLKIIACGAILCVFVTLW